MQASLHPRLQQAHDLSDNAYEKVSILQALLASATNNLELTGRKRRCVDAAPSGLNGASSSGTTSRRTSPATSLSASQPALQADESPQASLEAAPSTAPAKRGRGWRKGLGSSISSSSVPTIAVPTSTANTPSLLGGWTDPARARREQLGPQLPLQPGRKVTFRSPSNKADQVPKDEYEGWIMATVVECINNDRNRYVVRDDDPDVEYVLHCFASPLFLLHPRMLSGFFFFAFMVSLASMWQLCALPLLFSRNKESHLLTGELGFFFSHRTLYNTTLKAIVPLPESSATLPPRDYPSGHKVLAVYPDSTTFYPATILGGGPGLTRGITKVSGTRRLSSASTSMHFRR